MWWGYMKSMIFRVERLDDKAFRKFLGTYQWSCILKGKAGATAQLNSKSEQYWSPSEIKSFFPSFEIL